MHSPPLLAPAVTACRGHSVSYRNLAYRAAHLQYFDTFPHADPLFASSPPAGSRYVLPSGPPALYMSIDADTPYWEVNQDFRAALLGPGGAALAAAGGLRPDPAVQTGVHAVLSRLLDLFDLGTRNTLGVASDAELLVPWKTAPAPTATQLLGQAVFDDGFFEGVIYPSAQLPSRKNVVIFPARLQPGSVIDFRGFSTSRATLKGAHIP